MIPRHYMVVPEGVLELICINSSTVAHGGDCDTLHSQGNHDKMPIQLGRTRGEVYHTFCVLIMKSPLTYALVQRRRVISSCSPQFPRNLKTLNSLGARMKSAIYYKTCQVRCRDYLEAGRRGVRPLRSVLCIVH